MKADNSIRSKGFPELNQGIKLPSVCVRVCACVCVCACLHACPSMLNLLCFLQCVSVKLCFFLPKPCIVNMNILAWKVFMRIINYHSFIHSSIINMWTCSAFASNISSVYIFQAGWVRGSGWGVHMGVDTKLQFVGIL